MDELKDIPLKDSKYFEKDFLKVIQFMGYILIASFFLLGAFYAATLLG